VTVPKCGTRQGTHLILKSAFTIPLKIRILVIVATGFALFGEKKSSRIHTTYLNITVTNSCLHRPTLICNIKKINIIMYIFENFPKMKTTISFIFLRISHSHLTYRKKIKVKIFHCIVHFFNLVDPQHRHYEDGCRILKTFNFL
jgi:hypothetical protein